MEQKYLYIIVFLVLLIIGFLVYWFVFRDSGGGDYKAGNVEEFNDGTLLECDNSTRFEAVDKENSEDQALCDNLKLKQVFLVECANNINATDYYQEHQTDCPGRDINSIIRGTTVTPFNLLETALDLLVTANFFPACLAFNCLFLAILAGHLVVRVKRCAPPGRAPRG